MKYKNYLLLFTVFILVLFGFIHKTFASANNVTTLGGLSLNDYCISLNQVNSNPVNSSNWQCNPSGNLINMNQACEWQYSDLNAYGIQTDSYNQYTWVCYTSPNPPPSPTPTPLPTPNPKDQIIINLNAIIASQSAQILNLQSLQCSSPSATPTPSPSSVFSITHDKIGSYQFNSNTFDNKLVVNIQANKPLATCKITTDDNGFRLDKAEVGVISGNNCTVGHFYTHTQPSFDIYVTSTSGDSLHLGPY